MDALFYIVAFYVAWIVLMRWALPRFGVHT